jgi:hypothetical protein
MLRAVTADDPEVSSLLSAISELLEALHRAAFLAEPLAARASLSPDEARDVRHEIQTVRDGAERMEAMITMRRLRLIRFRGHLPKGGYDVQTDGRHEEGSAPAPAL